MFCTVDHSSDLFGVPIELEYLILAVIHLINELVDLRGVLVQYRWLFLAFNLQLLDLGRKLHKQSCVTLLLNLVLVLGQGSSFLSFDESILCCQRAWLSMALVQLCVLLVLNLGQYFLYLLIEWVLVYLCFDCLLYWFYGLINQIFGSYWFIFHLFVHFLNLFNGIIKFLFYAVRDVMYFVCLWMKSQLMFGNFFINVLVQFTIINEYVFHFLYLWHHEGILLDQGLHGDSPADELLINWNEIIELLVIY